MSVAFGVVGALVAFLLIQWRDGRKARPSTVAEACVRCAMNDPKTGGPELRGRKVHEVIVTRDDEVEREFGGFGGSYVATCFCRRHCPGGCQNARCRKRTSNATQVA